MHQRIFASWDSAVVSFAQRFLRATLTVWQFAPRGSFLSLCYKQITNECYKSHCFLLRTDTRNISWSVKHCRSYFEHGVAWSPCGSLLAAVCCSTYADEYDYNLTMNVISSESGKARYFCTEFGDGTPFSSETVRSFAWRRKKGSVFVFFASHQQALRTSPASQWMVAKRQFPSARE